VIADRTRTVWWGASLAWALLTVVLLLMPPSPEASGWLDLPGADKLLHAGAFGLLALLLERATRRPALTLLVTALYGVVTELLQLAAAGRSADPFDALADLAGAALALAAVTILRRSRGRQRVE
jgi:VanZ family protein